MHAYCLVEGSAFEISLLDFATDFCNPDTVSETSVVINKLTKSTTPLDAARKGPDTGAIMLFGAFWAGQRAVMATDGLHHSTHQSSVCA